MERKNEFPMPNNLLKEREDVIARVNDAKRIKDNDLEGKIEQLDINFVSLVELDEYLKKAKENLSFYYKLKKTGQLPAEDGAKLTDAAILVEKVEKMIAEKKEESKKIMEIPEIKEKVKDLAIEEENRRNESKKEEEIKKMVSEWVNEFKKGLELLRSQLKEKLDAANASKEKLKKKFGKELSDEFSSIAIDRDIRTNLESFETGLFDFSKRKIKKAILSSEELESFETCQRGLNSLGIEFKYDGEYNNLFNLVNHVFEKDEKLKNDLSVIKRKDKEYKKFIANYALNKELENIKDKKTKEVLAGFIEEISN
jgi:hypothetical protein